jgi:hypothetical protein
MPAVQHLTDQDPVVLPGLPMSTTPAGTVITKELLLLALELADDMAITDIESEGHAVQLDGAQWWDTRPMTDANRHGPDLSELFARSLRYALVADLIEQHAEQTYLVRILNRG